MARQLRVKRAEFAKKQANMLRRSGHLRAPIPSLAGFQKVGMLASDAMN